MNQRGGLRLLQAASFTSSFDRVMIAPLLVVIAQEFDLSLASVTIVATVHLVGYGAMQLVWAMLSDRYGRVRVMRLALLAAALASLVGAVSGSLAVLIAARAAAGAAFAAVIPGALVYVGDTVPVKERQGPLTDLMRGTAVGAAAATVGAGALADLTSWRMPFVVMGVAAGVLVLLLRRLPEPAGRGAAGTGASGRPGSPLGWWGSLRAVLRDRWALLVLLLALGEGTVLLAVLNFVPASLQATEGLSATAAGGVVALYGVGALLAAPLVKRMASVVRRSTLIGLGGATASLSLAVMPVSPSVAGLLIGCGVLGCGWAFMHSSLQTWATDVKPEARATAVSLFATFLFLGNAAGTFAGGRLLAATGSDFRGLFLAFALLCVPVVATAWLGSRRYER